MAQTESTASPSRPPLLIVAFILMGIEILGLGAAGIWILMDRPDGAMSGWGYSLTMSAVILMFAALLFFGTRGLWHGMRWGRGPVITWQLLQFVTATTMSDVISKTVALVVALVGLTVIAGFLSPASLAATSKTLGAGPDGSDGALH